MTAVSPARIEVAQRLIRRAMRARGFSVQRLAMVSGIYRGAIDGLLCRGVLPSERSIHRIGGALRLDLSFLEPPPPPPPRPAPPPDDGIRDLTRLGFLPPHGPDLVEAFLVAKHDPLDDPREAGPGWGVFTCGLHACQADALWPESRGPAPERCYFHADDRGRYVQEVLWGIASHGRPYPEGVRPEKART